MAGCPPPLFLDFLELGYIMLNKKMRGCVNNYTTPLKSACYTDVNTLLDADFFGDLCELFRRQMELFAVEIDIFFALNRD